MQPNDQVRFWRDPDLAGMEFRVSQYERFAFSSHTHDTYSIGLVHVGGSRLFDRGPNDSRVFAGEIAVLAPGEVHSGVPLDDSGLTYHMLYVNADWLRGLHADLGGAGENLPCFRDTVLRDPALRNALRFLVDLTTRSGRAEGLAKQSASVVAFSWLLARHGEAGARRLDVAEEPRAVRLAREYLADNYARKISLDELAAVTGLSRYHLLRQFKRSLGLPPHAWQIQQRVQRAQHLLAAGEPIVEAALATGFTDQSHFSKIFKQIVGATPNQYRRSPA
ncbi:MAG: helix-turn-helix domain-containing protein [Desulfovibrio sp.]